MRIFRKLHDRVEAPGLELRLLKALPIAAGLSIAMPLLLAWAARPYSMFAKIDQPAKFITSVEIFAFSVAITLLTAVFTVAIGCVVVWIMKGPAYVADAYPVSHANRPVREEADSLREG